MDSGKLLMRLLVSGAKEEKGSQNILMAKEPKVSSILILLHKIFSYWGICCSFLEREELYSPIGWLVDQVL